MKINSYIINLEIPLNKVTGSGLVTGLSLLMSKILIPSLDKLLFKRNVVAGKATGSRSGKMFW